MNQSMGKQGGFIDRDLYVSVTDMSGKTTANGGNPRLLGKDNLNYRDADGKFIVKERIDIVMGDIQSNAKKIGDIIGVIDGIAVVATEVRHLAQRSAEAAKDIQSLINTSIESVDVGARLVGDAGTTMHEIVDRLPARRNDTAQRRTGRAIHRRV